MLNNSYIKQIVLLAVVLVLCACGTSKSLHHQPITEGYNTHVPEITKQSDSLFTSNKNSYTKWLFNRRRL